MVKNCRRQNTAPCCTKILVKKSTLSQFKKIDNLSNFDIISKADTEYSDFKEISKNQSFINVCVKRNIAFLFGISLFVHRSVQIRMVKKVQIKEQRNSKILSKSTTK